MNVKCKLVAKTGERFYLRVFWGTGAHGEQYGYHNAMAAISDLGDKEANMAIREVRNEAEYAYWKDKWPTKCERCGEAVPPFTAYTWETATRDPARGIYQFFYRTLYDDPPRELQSGDMFWAYWMPRDLDPRGHLMVVCPGGGEPYPGEGAHNRTWDTMSIATNCGHGTKEAHYCWTRTGEPPDCTIRPSILIGGYHGFVTNGELVPA